MQLYKLIITFFALSLALISCKKKSEYLKISAIGSYLEIDSTGEALPAITYILKLENPTGDSAYFINSSKIFYEDSIFKSNVFIQESSLIKDVLTTSIKKRVISIAPDTTIKIPVHIDIPVKFLIRYKSDNDSLKMFMRSVIQNGNLYYLINKPDYKAYYKEYTSLKDTIHIEKEKRFRVYEELFYPHMIKNW